MFGLLCQESITDIVKLAIVHRHGDRTPNWPWIGAPISNASEWPEGWYQLTLAGEQRLYKLGQFLRNKYPSVIGEDPTEVLVRSSHRKRCLRSTQSLVAGAFPPSQQFEVYPGLKWQPIPVFIDDWLLRDPKCPEADKERARLRTSGPESTFNAAHKEFYEHLSNLTGTNVTNSNIVNDIRDRVRIAMDLGKTVPSWVTDELMERMLNISINEFYFRSASLKLKRLRSGVFFKDLLSQFLNPWGKKFLVYSTHDTQVGIFMNTMNLYPNRLVEFGSSLLFELHSDVPTTKTMYPVSDFYVKSFYLSDTYSENGTELKLPGCQSLERCPLSNFIDAMQRVVVDDIIKECGLN